MQPPPGYPQGQQNPQFMPPNQPNPPQQYAPQQQPYPQQYAPQYAQYPYYPPRKSGMPGWAWGLIIGAIVLFVVLPIMALAAIPLITSNTREARRAEGEQLMGAARDFCRVRYSMSGVYPTSLRAEGAGYGDFDGVYFTVDDAVRPISRPQSDSSHSSRPWDGGSGYSSQWAEITCTPVSGSDGRGHCEFDWASGNSTIRWD